MPPDASTSDALAPEPGSVSGNQIVYSTNSVGTWSADAQTPFVDIADNYVQGSATFTGPSGYTRKMGVCLLQSYKDQYYHLKTCSTVSDCANAPSDFELPYGGTRYCTAPNGGTTKYCYFRPGSQTSFCAGSPALGGAAVAPGTYWTPEAYGAVVPRAQYISYGCFEGCAATDPSSSSAASTICKDCGGYCCF